MRMRWSLCSEKEHAKIYKVIKQRTLPPIQETGNPNNVLAYTQPNSSNI
jgi:hypothetical protein